VIEPQILLGAYASGYFPMADSCKGEVRWYSPDPRAIIPLEGLKISRSLKQVLRKKIFEIRLNTAFADVIGNCAERKETWISDLIVRSYLGLHRLGFAHSVEAWKDGRLAGGLYGVSLGAAFFGESMFSAVPNASKVALVFLVERLRRKQYDLLDSQIITPHIGRMGAVEISREKYLFLLGSAIKKKCSFIE